jgi:excinuclease ABC subunit B
MNFKLKADYKPTGDQPQAIEKLTKNYLKGVNHQVLLGVTGSGKTYTMANVIQNLQKPALLISHNKTLAAQLYQEFKEFFPENAVSYFVSYYDYYQPEAYIPQTDTYIAKETDINQEIDKLRLQATSDIFSRNDTIVISSVSSIYNIGSPEEYSQAVINLSINEKHDLRQITAKLVSMHYSRSRLEFTRGNFRQRGNTLEIYPPYGEEIIKAHFQGNKIYKITKRSFWDYNLEEIDNYNVYPAKHYLGRQGDLREIFKQIREETKTQVDKFNKQGKLLEANRIEQRVNYDLEMIEETGYVNGIENYSRYFDGRSPGDPPYSLIDYFNHKFGKEFLLLIDESHITIPQIRGMYRGDQSRKQTLIDFGFRLPSALDNRPLKFNEFLDRAHRMFFISATPSEWEKEKSNYVVVEQLIRPTGLIDPLVEVRKSEGQIADLINEIAKRKKNNERVLVTTLTKRMSEELSKYLSDKKNTHIDIKVNYLHADIDTMERSDILADLRKGDYDVIVGINLLREGLDLPEVSLVVILDADKQGFLRSKTSLVQTMGRAARNSAGKVILYADEVTDSMDEAINEVRRRRAIQLAYNKKHGITPKTIQKPIRERILPHKDTGSDLSKIDPKTLTPGEAKKTLAKLKREMNKASRELDFERAIEIRNTINKISDFYFS